MQSRDQSESLSPPRICLLTPTFYPVVGGGETHALLLAFHLNELGMSTFVLTRRSDARLPERELVENTWTYRLPPAVMKRLGKYAMVPFVYSELLRRRHQYDVIFVCAFTVLGLPAVRAARMLGKVCVLRAESMGEMSGRYASVHGSMRNLTSALFRRWVAWRNRQLEQADAFISICGPIRDEFVQCGVPPTKIATIPNGVDLNRFRTCTPADKHELRQRLGLPTTGTIFAYSGKLNQGKGLESLLRAWASITSTTAGVHLLLVGSGGGQSISCEDDLRGYVREHGLPSVVFTGYVRNVHEYLQASDVFVFPTEYEAFGLSLVEAMSCGLPVIASRVGGIPEIVTSEENGLLVEPGNTDVLTAQMLRILGDPRMAETIADRGKNTAQEHYSIQSVAERYYELFARLHHAKANPHDVSQ